VNLKPEKQLFLHILGRYLIVAGLPAAVLLILFLLKLPTSTVLVFASIVLIAVSILSAWIMFSRLRTLAVAIEEICVRLGSGHTPVPSPPILLEIVTRLFNVLNQTANRIDEEIVQLRQKKAWWDAIFDTSQEGLLILDRQNKIVAVNNKLQQFLNGERATGKFYWEVIRTPQLSNLLQQLNSEQSTAYGEIEFNSKTFLCSAVHLSDTGQRVLTFSDITEIVTTEKIKREFVASVSHELKTPLTAIKGYIETMEETADENNAVYLQIVRRHTERLINLVQDLLNLSALENPDVKLYWEDVNLKTIANNVLAIFENAAKRKGLKLIQEIPEPPPIIKGDGLRLEQALINLLDNAIKYTEKGTVSLRVKVVDGQVVISIQDTGIGIAAEHIPRIFERFYVVDRSRSRQSGGTGLGLAIVKHIVELHQGKISVESTPGKGSEFSVVLPMKR
jgi:two-component system phosphate regulon sensor histidine kinase PhoR